MVSYYATSRQLGLSSRYIVGRLDFSHALVGLSSHSYLFFYFVFVYLLSEKSPVENADSRESGPEIAVRRVQ